MPNLDPHLKVWRVNLQDRTLSVEPTPESWQPLGGRALLARILLDETPPECDPLGEYNKLVFAPGLLVGHMLSSCDRISIGAKSPLTGGIKEANAGGRTGLQLALLGIKALIIEGRPDPQDWMVLHLSADGARFEPAGDLVGKGVYDTAPPLLEKYGDKVAIALIGPGGERGLLSAGIQNADKEGTPSRIAARGGLGALMGSRRLKAIVIDGSGGDKPPIANPKAFSAARKAYNKALMGHPQTKVYADYGTIAVARMCQSFGVLTVRNFSQGTFEGLETISAEHMRATLLARGGDCDTSHACMVGCAIRSSNVYGDPDGKAIVSPLEYETIGLLGPNLGIDNLDTIARLNREVNDLGLDTIEIGCSLGVAADAGLMDWGDGERALELLHEIRQDTPLGRILGHGPALAGKVLGVERVPVVKNQAMSAYDPRALKGTGVTYATSPQGADHTCGLTIRAPIDHLDPKGQVELSRNSQIKNAGFDTLGACMFTGFGFNADLQVIPDLLNARYGWNLTTSVLEDLGRESLRLELEYNRRAGFTRADDRIPEWMAREPLAPTNAVFDVDTDELDHIWDIFDQANANSKPA